MIIIDVRCPICKKPTVGNDEIKYYKTLPKLKFCKNCYKRIKLSKENGQFCNHFLKEGRK